jgi:hypothetical protein
MKHTTSLLVLGLAVLAPSIAQADAYVELGGGLVLPVSDNDWQDAIDPSLGLAARIGGGGDVGGMFSFEWDPLSSNINYVSFSRFRFLGHVVVHHRLNAKTELVGRFGAGIDIIHSSVDETIIGGIRIEGSDSDVGLAFEAAGGAWFSVGRGSTQLGVELALPIGYHNDDGNRNNPADPNDRQADYTSVDIQILGGVRLRL